MIQAMKNKQARIYSMEQVYDMLGTSRQSIAQGKMRRARTLQLEAQIISAVKDWRIHHPKMGSREMYYSLLKQEIKLGVGVNKFESIVSKYFLGAGPVRSFKPMTSDGKGKENYKNLTNGLKINDINQLIVGDITYFNIKGQWHYIFTLKDVYSQFLLSLQADRTMKTHNLLKTLAECENARGSDALKNCIHHSDNGSQYNSKDYKKVLKRLMMKVSRAEDCKQNGSAEQLNHIVKNMYLKHWSIDTLSALKQACKELQYLNNHQRTIKQLGHKTPHDFERYIQSIPMKNRITKQMYDFEK